MKKIKQFWKKYESLIWAIVVTITTFICIFKITEYIKFYE
jgi:hypothetical protein